MVPARFCRASSSRSLTIEQERRRAEGLLSCMSQSRPTPQCKKKDLTPAAQYSNRRWKRGSRQFDWIASIYRVPAPRAGCKVSRSLGERAHVRGLLNRRHMAFVMRAAGLPYMSLYPITQYACSLLPPCDPATQYGAGYPAYVGKGALTREGTGVMRSCAWIISKCACPAPAGLPLPGESLTFPG